MTAVKRASDQGDVGLAFNGQGGVGYSRGANRYAGNQSGQTMRENYGRGPTTAGRTGDTAGPTEARGIKTRYNADSINMGRGPTNPGSTTGVKHPGNPDMINLGRGPRVGNKCY